MQTAEDFAREYYQLDKSNIESVRIKSAIEFAKKYSALVQADKALTLTLDTTGDKEKPYCIKATVGKETKEVARYATNAERNEIIGQLLLNNYPDTRVNLLITATI